MRVVGVDLSAEPVRTAVAVLEWGNGQAVVEELRVGADNAAVLAALMTADKAGIDAPSAGRTRSLLAPRGTQYSLSVG